MRTLFTLVFLLVASIASAQNTQVLWDTTDVATPTQAQGFVYKLYVTPAGATTPNAPVTLTSVLCGGTPPTVQCATVLPTTAGAASITGAKSELTATDTASGTESVKSAPFFKPAAVPTNLRITR
jgi:hypothetical protein